MNKREFGFKLKIDGDISEILGSLKQLQAAFDKVEMPDSLTKALTRDIGNAIQKVGEFGKKSEAAINSLSDSKEVAGAWKSVQKELNALSVKLEGIDSSKLFPKEVTANLDKATAAAEKYMRALESSKNDDEFKKKTEELKRIAEQQRVNESLQKKARQSELQAEAVYSQKKAQWTDQINQQYEEQQAAVNKTNQSLEDQKNLVKQLVEEQKKLQTEGYLTTQGKPFAKKNEAAKQLPQAEAEATSAEYARRAAKGAVTRYENKNGGKNLKKDQEYLALKQKLTEAENKHAEALKKVEQLKKEAGDTKKLNRANEIGAEIAQAKEMQKVLEGQATEAKNAATDLEKQKGALDQAKAAYSDAAGEAAAYAARLEQLGKESEELNQDLRKIQTDSAEEEWKELVRIVKEFTGVDLSESAHDMDAFMDAINQYRQGAIDKLPETLKEILTNAKPIPQAVGNIGKELNDLADDVDSATRAANEMENLKNQVLDFFSISNSIQLFKRAVTSALNTVKELDATMTEAAVVTEFDVSDMWEKLPQYSKEAQNLGVSINGMYQATTLYYQQGLKSQEAMELGIETMKMGKIAAMDSTEATKAMTAALRGFNMELNETSATRVNDVYSQLAAVTAADTNQIATAMEKTASIAASANMEFETTAAFLAQIIETTQEAPETAGTALKTIIARFAEVKSLREQGLTSGEDDEGEIIDVNKIQTALRTVGISMEGFFNGTEGLDSILLKLSEKWGTLDFETQRYIATMAAGSRQQSRFIAMMSDYGRTTELVGEAQNSAGASQKQFEKTQESLETSIQRLENAWKQFLMGLANNEALKSAIDGLTKIMETINKTTDFISGGNGLIKSIVSLAGVLATLKGGKNLLGGTAVGGAMSGLVEKLTGSKGGEGIGKKASYFALPEGVKTGTTLKEKLSGGYRAKRNQIKAQRGKQSKGIEKYVSKVQVEEDELKHRIRKSVKNASTSQEAAELSAIDKQLKRGMITADEAAKKYEALGGKITKTSLDFNAMGQAANTAGMAMMAAGAATSLLASAFESWGMEEEAEAMQTLSGILMTLGPILMGIGSFLPVLTGLTAAQAAATWAALWPILLIVAALGALIAIWVLAAKAAHENSLEGRMEAAAEATERAKEAAEEAKTAYEDLLSAKEGYDELQNQLDNLTKGTLEWKKALADSNAQVLELLDKYPELAKYLTRGQYGELEISEEGWKVVEEQQNRAVENTQAALVASQMDETRLREEKAQANLEESAKKAGIYKKKTNTYTVNTGKQAGTYTFETNEDTTEIDRADLQEILKKYKSNGEDLFKLDADGSYSQELEKFAKSIGQTAEEIYNMKDALAAYESAMADGEMALQAQSETLLSNVVSEKTLEHKFSDEVISGMAAGFSVNQQALEDKLEDELYTDSGTQVRDNAKFKELVEENGVNTTDLTGDDAHDLEVLYAKMAGITREEIADGLKGNADKLVEEIAKIQATRDAGVKTEELMGKLAELDHTTQQKYATLMSKDISNATLSFAEMESVDYKQMAQDLGFGEDLVAMANAFGYETIEKMEEGFTQVIGDAKKRFGLISQQAELSNINIHKKVLKGASIEQLQSYVDLMSMALTTGGNKALEKGFYEIFDRATDEQDQKILDLMSTFDWTKEGAGEEFLEGLKAISSELYNAAINSEDFKNSLVQANAVFRNFDISDIFNKVKEGFEEADKIAGQEELTHEQFEQYLEKGFINEDEWVFNGKGWVNVTNGMDGLVSALKANTEAVYNSTLEEAKKKIEFYNDTEWLEKGLKPKSRIESDYKQSLLNGEVREEAIKWAVTQGISEDSLRRWLELKKTGVEDAKRLVKLGKSFDISKTQIGDQKDPYDKYYSIYEELEAIARQRERLEKQRNKLLQEGNNKQARENQKNYRDTIVGGIIKQSDLSNKKQADINTLMGQINSINGKIKLSVVDGAIKFNEQEASALQGTARDNFDNWLKELEKAVGDKNEADDKILDLELDLKKFDKEDRQQYVDAINKVKEALLKQRQDEIDELKNINNSINDTNSKILKSMQEQLNESRQTRDNAKTEQELSDKERRLAYLQQDTSGANATEILKLQKEIEEGQESYTDKLIDQKISELQKQNDLAAEQREHQIKILEEQKALLEQGAIWPKVYETFEEAFASDGKLNMDSSLIKILKDTSDFGSMSKEEQETILNELKIILGMAYGYSTKQYATGGLADFTGPAWLDGSKSRPEYVLNADQTQAFFSLVDVLTGLGFGNSGTSQNIGGSIYDIDINVESIGSDYDVEQMAEKVKGLIVDTSRYRNNNTL